MTIELHANLLNSMPGKLNSLLGKLTGQDTTLKDLQSACKNINSDEIDLNDVITSIQSSSDNQGEQKKKIEALKNKVENFIDRVEQIDKDVHDLIERRKKAFYKAHYNLKPDSEKGRLERFFEKCKGNLKKVGEWCREHWKLIVGTLIIVALVIAVICTGGAAASAIGFILAGALKGALVGALTGALISGSIAAFKHYVDTGSCKGIWQAALSGAEDGFLTGVITGGIFGAVGSVKEIWQLSKFGKITWGQGGFNPANWSVVTRWGRPGLQAGDWVMKGGNTWKNYILSGKFQPGFGNQYAPKSIGQSFVVLKNALVRPNGKGIDGIIKIIVNQWKYLF